MSIDWDRVPAHKKFKRTPTCCSCRYEQPEMRGLSGWWRLYDITEIEFPVPVPQYYMCA